MGKRSSKNNTAIHVGLLPITTLGATSCHELTSVAAAIFSGTTFLCQMVVSDGTVAACVPILEVKPTAKTAVVIFNKHC